MYRTNWGIGHSIKEILESHKGPFTGEGHNGLYEILTTSWHAQLAINLASLPKVIGKWKDDDIKIDIGKFGPYIRCGKVTSSVPRDQNLFELSEKEAGELLNSGKQGRGPKVIKELGDNIEIRDGRYGVYITDGKVNAKMPKDISQDELTLEEAKNLIEQKKSSPKRKFRKK